MQLSGDGGGVNIIWGWYIYIKGGISNGHLFFIVYVIISFGLSFALVFMFLCVEPAFAVDRFFQSCHRQVCDNYI